MQSPPESICVVRLSHIGDTCHALAVVRAIQDTWPETKLTWVIGKTEAALLADIPGIEFIIFDKGKGGRARQQLRARLRQQYFDVALCMHASMRINPVYLSINSPVRLGYDRKRARDWQWLFTNQRIASVECEHVLDAMMGFARHLGIPKRPLRWDIPLAESHLAFAARHTAGDEPVLLMSPCSSQRLRNYRNWSAENYAAAARHAQQKFGCRIILTGGPSELEHEYGMTISTLCGDGVVNLIGKTSLKELYALIAASDLLVAPDSGPVHMATAAGTPVIGLYATSNPGRSGPYLSQHLTVNAYPAATERFLGKPPAALRWGHRVRDPAAMDLIRLKDVNARIDAFFSHL